MIEITPSRPGRDTSCHWRLLFVVALACFLPAWTLVGLRHVNHDDLYFDLVAHHESIALSDLTTWVASFGRRFSHLLNVPLSIVTLRIVDVPILGDLAILAQIGVILGGSAVLIHRLAGAAAAAGWVMLLAGGYALHWYFMPPLGYPLHGLNSVMLLVLSVLLLVRHIERGGAPWLVASLACSGTGIIWPEFNFLLFPAATGATILLLEPRWSARIRRLRPFLVIWSLVICAQFAFRFLMPATVDEARMTIGLDPMAWVEALGTLLAKGLLPVAMLVGVDLFLAAIPGIPVLPARIDYSVLWHVVSMAPLGFAAVLLAWSAGFWLVLGALERRWRGLCVLLAAGFVLLLVPLGVVALSSEYQRILRLGYVQGAVATAHGQAGFLTMLFAVAALLTQAWPNRALRGVLALSLGALCCLTLVYNLLMRDVMAANHQRWLAFALMAQAAPDGTRLHAPSLWLPSGVSLIPGGLTFGMQNYWTERARIWHGKRVVVAEAGAVAEPGDVQAAYGIRRDGAPLVLLRDGRGAWLIARQRPSHLAELPEGLARPDASTWQCEALCRLLLSTAPDASAEARLLARPEAGEWPSLLDWVRVPRRGGVGAP